MADASADRQRKDETSYTENASKKKKPGLKSGKLPGLTVRKTMYQIRPEHHNKDAEESITNLEKGV